MRCMTAKLRLDLASGKRVRRTGIAGNIYRDTVYRNPFPKYHSQSINSGYRLRLRKLWEDLHIARRQISTAETHRLYYSNKLRLHSHKMFWRILDRTPVHIENRRSKTCWHNSGAQ